MSLFLKSIKKEQRQFMNTFKTFFRFLKCYVITLKNIFLTHFGVYTNNYWNNEKNIITN